MKEDNNTKNTHKSTSRILLPLVIAMILIVLLVFSFVQRRRVVANAEQVATQMAEYIASNISNEIDYAYSSITLSAVTIAQTMTSNELENPAEVILPMVKNTPFEGIEYIRTDGMNVMNIGEAFDASDRVYYIEGIKGHSGIWNNYHPKTSKETLMNFYTPLIYDNEICGVITGYIAATTQIAPLFETQLYGKRIEGVVVDENNMVICSTIESEYVKDLTLEMFINQFDMDEQQKQKLVDAIGNDTDSITSFEEPVGYGRLCVTTIPNTDWKVAIIIPAESFVRIINENTRDNIITIIVISIILVAYIGYILVQNFKRRKAISMENARLEEENSSIRDIMASANMGTWSIELVDDEPARMFVDDTMKNLLGISGEELTPEETYAKWFDRIVPEAVDSVLKSVERMEQGSFDENTYLWMHPTKGTRYVRCGGTARTIQDGYILRGYHYDVDDVVREDQAKVAMIRQALDEKNEYYSTLGSLGDIFYTMHVIDLREDTTTEFTTKDDIRTIVNHNQGAVKMMHDVMNAFIVDEYKEAAMEFSDLRTLSDRMKNKKIITTEFIGLNTGWVLASFITMEKDDDGKPVKVIFTTRVIDEEKKQEERLIKKSQTDELTGLLNRRAYEEDIYEHNDVPVEDEFIYVSLDVNGLKVINDTLGHMAGDELIIGSCQCMKESLGPYGKLYRIGGDEFVAILSCDEQKVQEVLAGFDTCIANWSGKLVDSLSISYGWISKHEEPGFSVRQLGAVAEKRMYDSKTAHYRKTGVDRRGQQDAHKALCELYTKILRINITDDSYQVINMDVDEQTEEKGFSNRISEWLKDFGTTGQVHPDDLDEYLEKTNLQYMKEYFAGNKTSMHIFYRRKYGSEFKQVMMEIIPTNDYSLENQSLFLYVKDIDK